MIEKLEKIPNSMFTDITAGQKTEATVKNMTGGATVSDAEAVKGADHTRISSIIGESATPGGTTITNNPTQPASVTLGSMIEGKLAVELADALLPSLLVSGLYFAGIKLRKTEIQLTAKEKEVITPVLQECLNSVNINFNNPWKALFVTLTVIYGAKIVEKGAITWIDKKEEKKAKNTQPAPVENTHYTQPIEGEPSDEEIRARMAKSKKGYAESRDFLIRKALKDKQRQGNQAA